MVSNNTLILALLATATIAFIFGMWFDAWLQYLIYTKQFTL